MFLKYFGDAPPLIMFIIEAVTVLWEETALLNLPPAAARVPGSTDSVLLYGGMQCYTLRNDIVKHAVLRLARKRNCVAHDQVVPLINSAFPPAAV